MCHIKSMKEHPLNSLSPAAQAVAEAYWRMPVPNTQNHQLAAALQAVADQLFPESECNSPDQEEWIGQSAWAQCCCSNRYKLLAIAD